MCILKKKHAYTHTHTHTEKHTDMYTYTNKPNHTDTKNTTIPRYASPHITYTHTHTLPLLTPCCE